jgi:hypothetical protein
MVGLMGYQIGLNIRSELSRVLKFGKKVVCLGHFQCNIVFNVLFNWKPVIWSFFLLCLLERKLGNENQLLWKFMWHFIMPSLCPPNEEECLRHWTFVQWIMLGNYHNNWLWFCSFSLAVKFLMNTVHEFFVGIYFEEANTFAIVVYCLLFFWTQRIK